jgi:hypothetical protein
MDLAKYLSLLDTSSLYFARPDMFDDHVEGYHPEANARLRDEFLTSFPEDTDEAREASELIASPSQTLDARKRVAINCWHQSKIESHALWGIYGAPLGVAIDTTAGRLIEALSAESRPVHVGMVRYVTYERVLIDFDQWAPFLCKRKEFAHEREVRLLIDATADDPEHGVSVSVDLDKLIGSVYVNPAAPEWFHEVVRQATARHGVDAEVKQSSLASSPAALHLPDVSAETDEPSSIAYRIAILMGEDLAATWAELVEGFAESQVHPAMAMVHRLGADPRQILKGVAYLLQVTADTVRSQLDANPDHEDSDER